VPTLTGIRVDGIPDVTGKLSKLSAAMPRLVAQALYTSAIFILKPAIQTRVRANRSVFRGQLFQRIGARVVSRDPLAPAIELGALGVPYGMAVEEGAPPHSPDAAKLLEYVKKKMGFKGEAALYVYAAVYATIRDKGTIPHPYIMPVWDAASGIFVTDALGRLRAKLGEMK